MDVASRHDDHTFGSHDPRICVAISEMKKKLVVFLVYIGDEILPSGDYFCFSHSEHDFMVKIWRFGIRHLPDKLFFSVKIPTTWCLLTRSGRRLKFKKSSKRPLVTGFQRSSDRMWEIITNSPQYSSKKSKEIHLGCCETPLNHWKHTWAMRKEKKLVV